MKAIKVTMHLYYLKYDWQEEGQFHLFAYNNASDANYSYVGPREIEVEVPENFDPRPAQIKALQEQRVKLQADVNEKIVKIDRRIAELLAIEHRP